MKDRLPSEHKQLLQNLHWEYKSANDKLEREAKFENFMKVLGALGVVIVAIYFLDRDSAFENFGEIGVGLGIGATLFGVWAFFFPSSQKLDRYERIQIRKVNEELEKLGYQRDFFGNQIARKGSNVFLDVFQDNNFTDLKRQPTASVAQSKSVTKEDPEPKIVQKEAAIETSTQEKVEQPKWVNIAKLPKFEFVDAMLTLFKEVDQNGNVQQLVAYSTIKPMFNASKRLYDKRGREFDKIVYINEIEQIISRQSDKEATRKLLWIIQAVLLWHLEDQAEHDKELHSCLVEIWTHMLNCCFNVKSALENNKIWTDDDKIHFDSFTLSNTKTVLMTIKTIAPKKVQEDIAFKQDYKEVMSFVELTESTS